MSIGRRIGDSGTDTKFVGIMSDEEIDLYLKGDRRDVDKLLLTNLNRLTALILSHMKLEGERNNAFDAAIEGIGGEPAIKLRAEYVDSLIERQHLRNAMMEKVVTSSVLYALGAFAVFVLYSVRESLVLWLKTKLGG